MEITIMKSTMVYPAEDTPRTSLWVSNMDLVMTRHHISFVFFYKPNGSSNFFDAEVLKEALGKILVPFYPIAGRLGYNDNGRHEIVCNAEGLLFTEAETTSAMDDLVTSFKCGGVSVGVSLQHTLADGTSALHFINSWADTARGLSPSIAPFLDRTLLRARDPPTPRFRHVEFEPSPTLRTVSDPEAPRPSIVSVFKITADQVKALKAKVLDCSPDKAKYSTYSILTAHIWRCVTKARQLPKDQEVKLIMAVDGRNRLCPPLPPGYFGNVIFIAAPVVAANDVVSEPFIDTVKRVMRC
ncbi:hypothetical protein PTKIN_Ptkin19aG0118700 [Pterospermum kingtungense]